MLVRIHQLSAIAFLVGVTSAQAREVDLLLFDERSVHILTASKVGSNLEGTLRSNFLGLTQLNPAIRSGTWPVGSQCPVARYTPTWWLTPEVELRRAAHFEIIASIACEYRIPQNLLDAVIAQESGYKGLALSTAGAMGIMQIMPSTARSLGLANPWDSVANMRAGARYLRQQLDRFGRVDLALAAYNAGPERRSLAHGNVPAIPETINYVRTITKNWARLAAIREPTSDSVVRAAAATIAIRASGYREVNLTTYDGTNAANPI